MEEGDSDEIIRSPGYIARARGVMQLAKDTGPARESFYRALFAGVKPRFDTIMRVTNAPGLKLTIAT